jgi:ribose transport system ATP-binding protein
VLGLTGLAGMGQDEIPALLLGLVPVGEGEVAVRGKTGQARSPRAALREGIAYLAPSRARSALTAASVADNVTMPVLPRYFRHGRLDRGGELADVGELVKAFDVRPAAPAARMSSLSGGNQQKVLLARLQHSQAGILLLHEPTHGVDVGAREQVLETVDRMRGEGRAIILISNEYEDLERVCDRVLVFGDGCVHAELAGSEVGQTAIAAACLRASLLDGVAA